MSTSASPSMRNGPSVPSAATRSQRSSPTGSRAGARTDAWPLTQKTSRKPCGPPATRRFREFQRGGGALDPGAGLARALGHDQVEVHRRTAEQPAHHRHATVERDHLADAPQLAALAAAELERDAVAFEQDQDPPMAGEVGEGPGSVDARNARARAIGLAGGRITPRLVGDPAAVLPRLRRQGRPAHHPHGACPPPRPTLQVLPT